MATKFTLEAPRAVREWEAARQDMQPLMTEFAAALAPVAETVKRAGDAATAKQNVWGTPAAWRGFQVVCKGRDANVTRHVPVAFLLRGFNQVLESLGLGKIASRLYRVATYRATGQPVTITRKPRGAAPVTETAENVDAAFDAGNGLLAIYEALREVKDREQSKAVASFWGHKVKYRVEGKEQTLAPGQSVDDWLTVMLAGLMLHPGQVAGEHLSVIADMLSESIVPMTETPAPVESAPDHEPDTEVPVMGVDDRTVSETETVSESELIKQALAVALSDNETEAPALAGVN